MIDVNLNPASAPVATAPAQPATPPAAAPAPVAAPPAPAPAPKVNPYARTAQRPAPAPATTPASQPAEKAPPKGVSRGAVLSARKEAAEYRAKAAKYEADAQANQAAQAELAASRKTFATLAEAQLASAPASIKAAVLEAHPKNPQAQLDLLAILMKHGATGSGGGKSPAPASTLPGTAPVAAPATDPDVRAFQQYAQLQREKRFTLAANMSANPAMKAAIQRGQQKSAQSTS